MHLNFTYQGLHDNFYISQRCNLTFGARFLLGSNRLIFNKDSFLNDNSPIITWPD